MDSTPTNLTNFSSPTPTNSSPASSPSSTSKDNGSSYSNESSDETPPRKFKSLQEIYTSSSFALVVSDPTSYEDATKMEEWQNAMKEELKAIQRNETWELTNLPDEKNIVGLKWIFKTKYHVDGSVQNHKARLVAKGYSQQQGIDFEKHFLLLLGLKWL